MTENPDTWITWQIEAQRIRIEQETARADQERGRREDLERLRLLEEKRLKEKEEKEEKRHKERIEAEERLRLLKEEKEEKRHKEKIEAEERLRLLEEKRLKEKEDKEDKRHKEKMEAEERWRVVEEQRMKEKAIADELFRKDKAEAAERQRAWDTKREQEREEDKRFNDARLLREAEERQERERRDIQRELNNKLMVDENARLDREERMQRYQEDKVDKNQKNSRYEVRLQRANDMLKGRIAELPEDIQGITTFFKMAEVLFANFNIPDDLKNPIITPFLGTRGRKVAMSLDIDATYEQLKKAICDEHHLTPRLYRSAFLNSFRAPGESESQFISRLSLSLQLYLDSRNVNGSFERFFALTLADRVKDSLDMNTRLFVTDRELADTWLQPKEIGTLVDLYQTERGINRFTPFKKIQHV